MPPAAAAHAARPLQEPELGNFYFGRNHPMKPHRVRLTHEVLVALSVERKLAMLPTSRLTMSEMSKYHTDECAPAATCSAPARPHPSLHLGHKHTHTHHLTMPFVVFPARSSLTDVGVCCVKFCMFACSG